MLKAYVYNLHGSVAQEIDLAKEVFGARVDRELLHRVLTAREFSRRASVAHTKTRGEVRGGGRKPGRQKGTGRAGQGSIRSAPGKGGGGGLEWWHVFPRPAPKTKRFVERMTRAKAHVPAPVHGAWGDSRRH